MNQAYSAESGHFQGHRNQLWTRPGFIPIHHHFEILPLGTCYEGRSIFGPLNPGSSEKNTVKV